MNTCTGCLGRSRCLSLWMNRNNSSFTTGVNLVKEWRRSHWLLMYSLYIFNTLGLYEPSNTSYAMYDVGSKGCATSTLLLCAPGRHQLPPVTFFSKLNYFIFGYSYPTHIFFIKKIKKIRGELSGMSTKTATLVATPMFCIMEYITGENHRFFDT